MKVRVLLVTAVGSIFGELELDLEGRLGPLPRRLSVPAIGAGIASLVFRLIALSDGVDDERPTAVYLREGAAWTW